MSDKQPRITFGNPFQLTRLLRGVTMYDKSDGRMWTSISTHMPLARRNNTVRRVMRPMSHFNSHAQYGA